MGSKQRFAYSALGDAVNQASRFEGQTKAYGVPIILGENTAQKVQDLALLELDWIRVKGKTKPSRIFALLGDAAMTKTYDYKSRKATHDAMLKAYRAGNFQEAMAQAQSCMAMKGSDLTALYRLYEARCREFLDHPPAAWDGVYEAKSK